MKCLLQDHIFEHLIPQLIAQFRLRNLQEAEPCQGKYITAQALRFYGPAPLPASSLCFLCVDSRLPCWLHIRAVNAFLTMVDSVLSAAVSQNKPFLL